MSRPSSAPGGGGSARAHLRASDASAAFLLLSKKKGTLRKRPLSANPSDVATKIAQRGDSNARPSASGPARPASAGGVHRPEPNYGTEEMILDNPSNVAASFATQSTALSAISSEDLKLLLKLGVDPTGLYRSLLNPTEAGVPSDGGHPGGVSKVCKSSASPGWEHGAVAGLPARIPSWETVSAKTTEDRVDASGVNNNNNNSRSDKEGRQTDGTGSGPDPNGIDGEKDVEWVAIGRTINGADQRQKYAASGARAPAVGDLDARDVGERTMHINSTTIVLPESSQHRQPTRSRFRVIEELKRRKVEEAALVKQNDERRKQAEKKSRAVRGGQTHGHVLGHGEEIVVGSPRVVAHGDSWSVACIDGGSLLPESQEDEQTKLERQQAHKLESIAATLAEAGLRDSASLFGVCNGGAGDGANGRQSRDTLHGGAALLSELHAALSSHDNISNNNNSTPLLDSYTAMLQTLPSKVVTIKRVRTKKVVDRAENKKPQQQQQLGSKLSAEVSGGETTNMRLSSQTIKEAASTSQGPSSSYLSADLLSAPVPKGRFRSNSFAQQSNEEFAVWSNTETPRSQAESDGLSEVLRRIDAEDRLVMESWDKKDDGGGGVPLLTVPQSPPSAPRTPRSPRVVTISLATNNEVAEPSGQQLDVPLVPSGDDQDGADAAATSMNSGDDDTDSLKESPRPEQPNAAIDSAPEVDKPQGEHSESDDSKPRRRSSVRFSVEPERRSLASLRSVLERDVEAEEFNDAYNMPRIRDAVEVAQNSVPNAAQHIAGSKRRVAVIVGISNYQDPRITSSQQCVIDAVQLASVLRRIGFQVRVLSDHPGSNDYPTRNNIVAAIEEETQSFDSAEDLCIVYCCGAGHNGIVGGVNVGPVIFAHDVSMERLGQTALGIEDLQVVAGGNPIYPEVPPNVVILDTYSVFGGLFKGCDTGGFALVGGRSELGTELVASYGDRHQLVMSLYLRKGLQGLAVRDNKVSVTSLLTYISQKLRAAGVNCRTTASSKHVGCIAVAHVSEVEVNRMYLLESRQRLLEQPSKFSFRFVTHHNCDPLAPRFLRNVIAKIVSNLSLVARKHHNQLKRAKKSDFGVLEFCAVNRTGPVYFYFASNEQEDIWSDRQKFMVQRETGRRMAVRLTGDKDVKFVLQSRHGHVVGIVNIEDDFVLDNFIQNIAQYQRAATPDLKYKPGSGHLPSPIHAKQQLSDRTRLESIGVEAIFTFRSCEFVAYEVEKIIRSGKLAAFGHFHGFISTNLKPQEVRDERAAMCIQGCVRGFLTRRKMKYLLRIMKREVTTRYGILGDHLVGLSTLWELFLEKGVEAFITEEEACRLFIERDENNLFVIIYREMRWEIQTAEKLHRKDLRREHDRASFELWRTTLSRFEIEAEEFTEYASLVVLLVLQKKAIVSRLPMIDEEKDARNGIEQVMRGDLANIKRRLHW